MHLSEQISVQIYQAKDGRSPFEDWLNDLRDVAARGRIRSRINRLRLGNFGDDKSVGAGVHELRVDVGPGYRVYFGRQGDVIVVLLCGGSKKTQEKDIGKAKILWAEYKERIG